MVVWWSLRGLDRLGIGHGIDPVINALIQDRRDDAVADSHLEMRTDRPAPNK